MVVGVLLMGAVGLAVLATPLLGNRALIVRSGSMEPTIAVGDIVIVHPGEYHIGEAIAYTMPGRENVVVTHRIVEVKDGAYITKGDANAEADSWLVSEADILGKELFVVPWVGHVLAFAKTKTGFAGLVLLPALVVILSEVRVIWRELGKKALLTPTPRRRFVDGLSARVAVIVLMAAVMTPATWALYSDSATSTNNVFAAAENFGAGLGDVVINEVMWMGSQGSPSDEWIELRNMTGSSIDLTDWKLLNAGGDGSSPDDIILAGTIPGNGYWLVGNNNSASSAIANTITVDTVTTDVELVNGGEQLILKDSAGTTIDASPVTIGSWPLGDNSPDQQSMARNSTPGDGTVASNWHTCIDAGCNDVTYWDAEGNNYGTPKATNL